MAYRINSCDEQGQVTCRGYRVAGGEAEARAALAARLARWQTESHPETSLAPHADGLGVTITNVWPDGSIHIHQQRIEVEAPRARLTDAQRAERAVAKSAANPYRDLPRVTYLERVEDAGEYGAATCPHCGAEGRYIQWFRCEDGSTRGAMRGCFRHFPQHPFVALQVAIADKERACADARTHGQSRQLASWDCAIREAIEEFAASRCSEEAAWTQVREAQARQRAYLSRRFGRR